MSAETLRKAAQILRERGLAKGVYVSPCGRVCAEGAIAVAVGGAGVPSRLRGSQFSEFCTSAEALRPVIGGDPVTAWNDAPGRTADEVIAALEAAADRLEAAS